MLVTPLEVYASVSSASLKRTLPSQRLVISQNSEATPIIIVQDDQRPKENQARFKYTDCRFVTGQQPHYEEHVKQLVTSFTEGYNTAGVSVYAKSNDPESQKRNMTGMALDLLKEQLLQKYVLSGDSESRNIKLEYGFIGFSDFRCYNYPSRTKLHNDKAMKMNVTDFLLPLPIDKIDDTWKTIKFDQNGGDPTLFICNLTRNNKLESCFAWLNFSAPSDSATYYASYAEMEKRLLVYSDPKFNGILDPYEYPMAAFTFNYFSGLYQTKVFAHFDEYGIYDTGINLDLLRDTSNWGNIKCSVSRNEFGVNLGKSQKKALQRELDEQTLTINQLKTTCSNQQETLTKLNEEIETYKPLEYRGDYGKTKSNLRYGKGGFGISAKYTQDAIGGN
ncbi:hypothetical protein BC941DRAFT_455118 [Chlamydoabsidia padenii]|nr:hypothetical protein BC941DRAFT_455118 [Chlamydoabsidia padenii]